jgi:CBS domain-containing protein
MTTVRDMMTTSPRTFETGASVVDAARAMADENIGDVIVCEGETVRGIVTDRDIAVRVVAQDRNPADTTVGDVCSADLITVGPDDDLDNAIGLMRQHAVRRIPVVDDGRPIGVLSLGDLAIERDSDDVLEDISTAPANS